MKHKRQSLLILLVFLILTSFVITGCKDKCPPEDEEIDTGKCSGTVYGDKNYEDDGFEVVPGLYITRLSTSIQVLIMACEFKNDSNHRGQMKYHFDDDAPADINYRIKFYKAMDIGYFEQTIVLMGDDSFIEKLKTAKKLTVELNGKTAGIQETTFDLTKIHNSCPFNPDNKQQDHKIEVPGFGTVDVEVKF